MQPSPKKQPSADDWIDIATEDLIDSGLEPPPDPIASSKLCTTLPADGSGEPAPPPTGESAIEPRPLSMVVPRRRAPSLLACDVEAELAVMDECLATISAEAERSRAADPLVRLALLHAAEPQVAEPAGRLPPPTIPPFRGAAPADDECETLPIGTLAPSLEELARSPFARRNGVEAPAPSTPVLWGSSSAALPTPPAAAVPTRRAGRRLGWLLLGAALAALALGAVGAVVARLPLPPGL